MKQANCYMDGLREKCKSDGVDFWELVTFKETKCFNLYKAIKDYETVNRLMKKRGGYNEEYILKGILQNDYVLSPLMIDVKMRHRIQECKKKCFEFLDKLDNPYEYIYSSLYFYNTQVFDMGYDIYQTDFGICEVNHLIARQYALSKQFKEKEITVKYVDSFFTVDGVTPLKRKMYSV